MKKFLDEKFLLNNKTAQELYHDHAKRMPIIDYCCYLSPQQTATDHQFQHLTQVWQPVGSAGMRYPVFIAYANVFVINLQTHPGINQLCS